MKPNNYYLKKLFEFFGGSDDKKRTDNWYLKKIAELTGYIFYDPCTSDAKASSWTIPSGVISQYSSDGWKITATAYSQIRLTEKLTTDCSVEFTISDYTSGNAPSIITYAYTNGETTPNQQLLIGGSYKSSDWSCMGTRLNHDLIKGGKYRIEYTTDTIKVYENDTLLGQGNNNVGFPTRFEIHIGTGGRYAVYKDIKVKAL